MYMYSILYIHSGVLFQSHVVELLSLERSGNRTKLKRKISGNSFLPPPSPHRVAFYPKRRNYARRANQV